MTQEEGLNVSQGGAYPASGPTQQVLNLTWSSGGRDQQRALNENLLERVLAPENLRRAWRQVRRNKGAPGIDEVTIEDYPQWAARHWAAARRGLEGGYCRARPVRRIEIPKATGVSVTLVYPRSTTVSSNKPSPRC